MIPRDENVLGLDVAMYYALRVRVAQCIGDFAKNLRRFLNRQLTRARNSRAQILATDERHRVIEERSFRARGKKWNDVRMLQPRSELNLPPKTIGVDSRGKVRRENLDDYLSLELGLDGDEDARHTCASELSIDAIGGPEEFLELGLKV
jgi:hypothetical protein